MKSRGYEGLIVWQKAMDVVFLMYKLTDNFPKSEIYGLVSQMRRCAVSIPSNIAEGSRRLGEKDTRHFLIISFGSGAELETQIKLAKRLSFGEKLDYNKIEGLLEEVMKMLNVMINK